jgi:hypothetical protein
MPSNNSIFSEFTNLYSLTKTLRFELRPTEETKVLLQKTNNLGLTPVQTDQKIDDLYNKEMKPMYDKLHEKFITESLQKVEFDLETLSELEKNYLEFKKLSKNKKENQKQLEILQKNDKGKIVGRIPDLQSKLRNSIVVNYEKTAENWKKEYVIKNKDSQEQSISKEKSYKILTESSSLKLLQLIYPEKADLIKDNFIGFHTYFTGFNQNRTNYYTNDGKVTEVAFRCINVNLTKFIENKAIFESAKIKISSLSEFDEYFKLEKFQNCLTQTGIEDFNDILATIKSKINLEYNQKANKNEQIRGFNKLHKQIGCKTRQQNELEKSGTSQYPDYLEKVGLGFKISKNGKDYQIWEAVESLSKQLEKKVEELQKGYMDFFQNWESGDYKLNEIWFRKEALNTISGRWFGGSNWSVLGRVLSYNGVGKTEDGEYKIPVFVNLLDIKEALEKLENGIEFDLFGKIKKQKENKENSELTKYTAENLFLDRYKENFKVSLFETFLAIWKYEIETKFKEIEKFKEAFNKVKSTKFDKNIKDENGLSLHTKVVKNLVEDGYLNLLRLTKYHTTDKKGELVADCHQDGNFYEELNNFWGDDTEPNNIVMYHKALQSSLTEKPFETDKIKLNFENGMLLGGWSDGQEKNKGGVILQNQDKFYLGILINRGFFRTDKLNELYQTEEQNWQRLILTNLKFQTLAGKGFLGKYGQSYGELGKIEPLKAVKLLQEFIKENYLAKYPQLKNVAEKEYQEKKVFDAEIKVALEECFTMNFVPIKAEILQQGLQTEQLYLFEITNKDFARKNPESKENLETIYWKNLFSLENLKSPKIALNGGGEIFFRKGQKEKLVSKKDKKDKEILDAKRYADDKYFFHVPITINYGKPKLMKFKDLLSEKIEQNRDQITYLGLDRGEKHLVYYALVDSKGKMLEQGSFNKITVAGREVDFHDKLTTKAGNRDKARKDWETIGNIKNFKEGYLSQVIHEIYQIVIKHNSLIILENLNTEFKAKRTAKVEKSVYKKFELALAKKLNHLVLKDKLPNEEGGVLQAYQLTPQIGSGNITDYEKSDNWGIIKKVKAAYTSAIDPLTHWRKHIYLSNSATEDQIKTLFGVDGKVQINWDDEFKCFRFDYREEITQDKKVVGTKNWSLYAHKNLERFRWNSAYINDDSSRGKILAYDDREEKSLYTAFKDLFNDLNQNENINHQLSGLPNFNWKSLVFYWNLLNQIRNTDTSVETDETDFIQSPVFSQALNDFFDSRKVARGEYSEYEKTNGQLPKNGDANGAYHIAKSHPNLNLTTSS